MNLRAELSGTYGPSCPLRAELSTGRVVHGPSCPATPQTVYYMSDNHESIQELLQYRIAFTCQIEYRSRFNPKVQKFAGNGLNKLCKPQMGRVSFPEEWVSLSALHIRRKWNLSELVKR